MDFESAEETITRRVRTWIFRCKKAFKDYCKPMNQRALEGLGKLASKNSWIVGLRLGFASGIGWWGLRWYLRYQVTSVFKRQSFPGAEDLLAPTWKKRVASSMVATNGWPPFRRTLVVLQSHLISRRSLSLSSFILRSRTCILPKLFQLIPGFSREETLWWKLTDIRRMLRINKYNQSQGHHQPEMSADIGSHY